DGEDQLRGGLGLELQVALQSRAMRDAGLPAVRLSRADFADMYWTPAQMLAHHASNGCNLCPGDLLASGTVSGSTEDARGCLLELTWRGTKPIALPSGETRRFLEDGDEVVISGRCARDAARSLGFGLCRGRVVG
ncbi:MAG: fumarylacetoacetate hydrolase family protein, partial [Gemmatimonadota bacterium]